MRTPLTRLCRMASLWVALGVVLTAAAQPTVYRCVDGNGKVAYQSTACGESGKQTEVKLPAVPPAPAGSARASLWKSYVPPKVAAITFYYDPAEEPVGFSTAQMEADIRAAIATWGAGCQVRLSYGGRARAQLPGTPERVPIRWAPEYMRMAHPADGRSGIGGTGSLFHGIALKPRFHEVNMLPLLVHEMGHVLGLPHIHEDPHSIMSYLQDESRRRKAQPSEGDFLACNLAMKKQFGTEFEPSAQAGAAPPERPRMSDREALERILGPRKASAKVP